jgi:hypothetical protein
VEGLVRPAIGETGTLRVAHEFGEMRILKAVEGDGNSKSHHGGEILLMVAVDFNPPERDRD